MYHTQMESREDEDRAHARGDYYIRIDDRSVTLRQLFQFLKNKEDFTFIGISSPPDIECKAIRIQKFEGEDADEYTEELGLPKSDSIYRYVFDESDSQARCFINMGGRAIGRQIGVPPTVLEIMHSHDEIRKRLLTDYPIRQEVGVHQGVDAVRSVPRKNGERVDLFHDFKHVLRPYLTRKKNPLGGKKY
jgi:hypothetical protein